LEARQLSGDQHPDAGGDAEVLGARGLKRHAGEPEARQPERDGSLAAQRLPEGDENEPR
jgi:hypothetical protein